MPHFRKRLHHNSQRPISETPPFRATGSSCVFANCDVTREHAAARVLLASHPGLVYNGRDVLAREWI
jgi:hypothetical protein